MFKKLLPFVLIAFISACANTQATTTNMATKMPCCEKCDCCKDGMCKMCMAKHKGAASTTQGEKGCPMCLKAKQEQMKRHQDMKR